MEEIITQKPARKYELFIEYTYPPMNKGDIEFLKDSFLALSMYAHSEGYSQNVVLNLFAQATEMERAIKNIAKRKGVQ